MKKAGYFCYLYMAFSLCSLTAGEWNLTENGKSNASIVIGNPPNASETMAIKELNLYTGKIAGCELTGGKYQIRLSSMKDAPEAMRLRLEKAENPDTFYLKTHGRELVIAGKTPRAMLYGVYTLLEKYIGCRWFYPGEQGEYTPKTPNIRIPDRIDDFQTPSFNFRRLCLVFAIHGKTGWGNTFQWMIRNKMTIFPMGGDRRIYPETNEAVDTVSIEGGHYIWYASVPYRKYFKTHPEYFALDKGKRNPEGQRCLTNPDVKKLLAEHVLNVVRNNGKRQIFSFGLTDNDAWCTCENCRAAGMYKGVFSQSQVLHKLYSEVCGMVLKEQPDAELWVDFYISGRTPPENPAVRYDKRVIGTYNAHGVCCAHTLDNPECKRNVLILSEMRKWRDRGPKVNFRGYYSVNNAFYAPLEMTLAHDLKFMKKEGFDGWWEEVATPGCDLYYIKENKTFKDSFLTCWPYFYMAAKLLWDVEQDPQQLIDDAFRKYYGKAAKPMIAARNYKQELWDNAPGHAYYNGPFRLGYCLNVPGAEKRFLNLFEEAEKLASGDPSLLAKIAMDRKHLREWGIDKAKIIKQANSGKNEIPVRMRRDGITIDGELNETDWKKAETLTDFKLISDRTPPTEETRVKVLFDGDHFYIGIEAMLEKAWSEPKAYCRTNDDPKVCQDDSVEFLIMPPGKIDSYCHWIINSAGTVYDAKNSDGTADTKFNTGGKIAVKKKKDRYTVEARIPVSDFAQEKIRPGASWKMHFVRGCTNLQPPRSNEGLGIDGIAPHDFQRWRQLIPGRQALPNGTFGILGPRPGHSPSVSSRFPVGWGGSKANVRQDGKVEILNYGQVGRYMTLPADEKSYQLNIEVRASGNGKIRLVTRTNCGRGRKGGGTFEKWYSLSAESQTLQFSRELEPYEEGYFFIISQTPSPVVIESATGAVTEKAAASSDRQKKEKAVPQEKK